MTLVHARTHRGYPNMFTQTKNKRIWLKWLEDIIFEYLTLEQLILMTKARDCL